MSGRVVNTEIECGCGRTVTEINYHARTHSCVVCDINQEGNQEDEN